jgi:hypothetical protein
VTWRRINTNWTLKTQATVTLSSTEAEYLSIMYARTTSYANAPAHVIANLPSKYLEVVMAYKNLGSGDATIKKLKKSICGLRI